MLWELCYELQILQSDPPSVETQVCEADVPIDDRLHLLDLSSSVCLSDDDDPVTTLSSLRNVLAPNGLPAPPDTPDTPPVTPDTHSAESSSNLFHTESESLF